MKDSKLTKNNNKVLSRENIPSKLTISHEVLGTTYTIPIQDMHEKTSSEILSTLFIRSIVLLKLDSLIILQDLEQRWGQKMGIG